MNEKEKVLVGIIADMDTDISNQSYKIEDLKERLTDTVDHRNQLRDEKNRAGEIYHVACVEKDKRIQNLEKELEYRKTMVDILDKCLKEIGWKFEDERNVTTFLYGLKEQITHFQNTTKSMQEDSDMWEELNTKNLQSSHRYRKELARLKDRIKREINGNALSSTQESFRLLLDAHKKSDKGRK